MKQFNIAEVLKYLPHRYPFLLVDRVLEREAGKYIVALKNVTINEPFFQGHFPEKPVMPGVLQLEAMAQASGLLTLPELTAEEMKTHYAIFAGIDNVKFKKMVMPGDQLILRSEITNQKRNIWKLNCSATVNDELACSANLTCALMEI